MKRIEAIFFLALFLVFSCGRNEESGDNTGLRITQQEIEFQFLESSYPVTVLTDRPWRLESDSDWLSASINGASQGDTFFVQATKNEGDSERSGTITISNDFGAKTIKVTQKQDDRNITDIFLSSELKGNTRLQDTWLCIPYREGSSIKLSKLSAGVYGSGKGSITVEPKEDIILEDGEGVIKLKVSGRTGAQGKVLFTVEGLPPTVFGNASQCMVTVSEGVNLQDVGISQVRDFSEGVIPALLRFSGYVISDKSEGVFDDYTIVVEDARAAIKVKTSKPVDFSFGDYLEIYADFASIAKEDGMLTLSISEIDDIRRLSSGNAPKPVEIQTMPESPDYESMLCSINLTQVTDEELSRNTCAGETKMERLGWNTTYRVYVPESATFVDKRIPTGSGVITGIVSFSEDGILTIRPSLWNDVSSLTDDRLSMDAVFETNTAEIRDIPAEGATSIGFELTSSLDWSLRCEGIDWIVNWSSTSGTGNNLPATVSFDVLPNTGARRVASITITAKGAPDITIRVVQMEGKRILDNDFSVIRSLLLENPKYFPTSAGTDYGKEMETIGLEGWYATNCYGALSDSEEQYGLLRIGKTLTRGYIQTPPLEAIGPKPVSIEANFLAGIYKGCKANWIGVELEGPGAIVENEDVITVTEYDGPYTDALMDKLPMTVIQDMNDKALARVHLRIDGATSETIIRLTATIKGGSTVASCNMFFIGDFHIEYID